MLLYSALPNSSNIIFTRKILSPLRVFHSPFYCLSLLACKELLDSQNLRHTRRWLKKSRSPKLTDVYCVFQNLVQALYDFTPQEHGELAFSRGDVIKVTDKSDVHWWKGEIGNREGLFPATYVQPYH